ncbi:hypothetical protein IWX90DRAFT_516235 [Phyllosticta citrichinensis]|uniref:Uncharacterized protein n=1 Tax=Phyllosticta citrichinensis TaxID=1130410 RepID=A0ABR1XM44_9PEZI
MADSEALNHLLAVLRERRVPLTRDDVQWAFESVKTRDDAVAWVDQYLQQTTLLSKEELDLYEKLCEKDPSLRNKNDLKNVQPILDDDLRAAITALEASTANILQQTKTLEAQMDALRELQKQEAEPGIELRRRMEERKQKYAAEKAQVDFAIEGLTDAITERVTSFSKQSKASAHSVSSLAGERLASDDRKFGALSELSKKLDGAANGSSEKKEVEQLSNTLVSLRCASIRTRVDRIFQERLRSASRKNVPDRTLEEAQAEKEALKEELETLHAEIQSVAEMSVEHEFRGPINASIEQSQTQQQRLQQRWLDYILSTVEYMTHRLSHLCTHATDLRAFHATLTEISDLYIATMQAAAPPPPPLPSSSSPSKSRGKDTATRVVELSKATEELLRHLDMSIPAPSKTTPAQARQSLAESTLERQNRLLLHQSATQAAVVKSIGEAVGNGNLEMQELLGALLANSEFKDLSLGNRRVVRGIEGLEVGIGDVSSYMPGLGERMDLAGSREGRAFVERWAGDV